MIHMNVITECRFIKRMPDGHYQFFVKDTEGRSILLPEFRHMYGGGWHYVWPFTEWFI